MGRIFDGMTPEAMKSEGMTLRDWFAGQALQSLIMRGTIVDERGDIALAFASSAFLIADAMLVKRKEAK